MLGGVNRSGRALLTLSKGVHHRGSPRFTEEYFINGIKTSVLLWVLGGESFFSGSIIEGSCTIPVAALAGLVVNYSYGYSGPRKIYNSPAGFLSAMGININNEHSDPDE